jgi:hypothetical protein
MPLFEPNNIPRLWTRWFAKADRKIKGLKSGLYENGSGTLLRNSNVGRIRTILEGKAPHAKDLDFPRNDRESCLLKY